MQTRISRNDATPVEMLPGLVRRTLAWGEKMMLCEFTADAGVASLREIRVCIGIPMTRQ